MAFEFDSRGLADPLLRAQQGLGSSLRNLGQGFREREQARRQRAHEASQAALERSHEASLHAAGLSQAYDIFTQTHELETQRAEWEQFNKNRDYNLTFDQWKFRMGLEERGMKLAEEGHRLAVELQRHNITQDNLSHELAVRQQKFYESATNRGLSLEEARDAWNQTVAEAQVELGRDRLNLDKAMATKEYDLALRQQKLLEKTTAAELGFEGRRVGVAEAGAEETARHNEAMENIARLDAEARRAKSSEERARIEREIEIERAKLALMQQELASGMNFQDMAHGIFVRAVQDSGGTYDPATGQAILDWPATEEEYNSFVKEFMSTADTYMDLAFASYSGEDEDTLRAGVRSLVEGMIPALNAGPGGADDALGRRQRIRPLLSIDRSGWYGEVSDEDKATALESLNDLYSKLIRYESLGIEAQTEVRNAVKRIVRSSDVDGVKAMEGPLAAEGIANYAKALAEQIRVLMGDDGEAEDEAAEDEPSAIRLRAMSGGIDFSQ